MALNLAPEQDKVPWYRGRKANAAIAVCFCVGVFWGAVPCVAWGRAWVSQGADSKSMGSVSSGSLVDGRALSPAGEGYRTYSTIGAAMGRQYVNSKLAETLIGACSAMARLEEGRTVIIGETGLRQGGAFSPHKTHQNGMSVDIMMPVRKRGKVSEMPTDPWRKFGYANEFDDSGQMGDYSIDFESLGALILEIEKQAEERSLRIEKIIVAPEYVSKLLATKSGRAFGRLERVIMRKPAWIRHDEHFHLDFGQAK